MNQREFFIDNLLVQIRFIIVMIRWTGLAPWEFEFPFPGSLTPITHTITCIPVARQGGESPHHSINHWITESLDCSITEAGTFVHHGNRHHEIKYRGTSLMRNCPPLGPYSRTMPRALRWSWGGWLFPMSEVPLYSMPSTQSPGRGGERERQREREMGRCGEPWRRRRDRQRQPPTPHPPPRRPLSPTPLSFNPTFDHPLFLITSPYIAHCMGACGAKGEWSLFSLSSLSRLSTPCPP